VSEKKKVVSRPGGLDESQDRAHRVRLPGFLIEEETGLGDALKRVTYAMGIKPCGGCEKNVLPHSTDGYISPDNGRSNRTNSIKEV
jgi:hypothetical protein